MTFLFLGLTAPAFAEEGFIACSNGDIETKGESYYAINILEDGVQFLPYESEFGFDASEMIYEDDVFTVVNKVAEVSSEGTSYSTVVNAILIKKGNALNVAVSEGKEPFRSITMTCKTIE